MDRKTAVEFVIRIEGVFEELDALLPFLKDRLEGDDLAAVGEAVSRMIGELDLGVLEVIYRAHPDLRPEGMEPVAPLREGE